ncbi:MAG: hypothetical protein ACKN9S_06430 [Pirellula sp.]
MISEATQAVARRATEIYEEKLKANLELSYPNKFLAIEPESQEYFFGETLSQAIQAARAAHPDRLAFALRIGHPTAIEIGVLHQ